MGWISWYNSLLRLLDCSPWPIQLYCYVAAVSSALSHSWSASSFWALFHALSLPLCLCHHTECSSTRREEEHQWHCWAAAKQQHTKQKKTTRRVSRAQFELFIGSLLLLLLRSSSSSAIQHNRLSCIAPLFSLFYDGSISCLLIRHLIPWGGGGGGVLSRRRITTQAPLGIWCCTTQWRSSIEMKLLLLLQMESFLHYKVSINSVVKGWSSSAHLLIQREWYFLSWLIRLLWAHFDSVTKLWLNTLNPFLFKDTTNILVTYSTQSSPSLLSFSDTQTQTNNGMLWVVLMFSTELEMKSFTSNRATKISRHGCFGGTMLTSMNPMERGTNSSIQLLLVASPCHSASQLPESKRDELQLQLIPI